MGQADDDEEPRSFLEEAFAHRQRRLTPDEGEETAVDEELLTPTEDAGAALMAVEIDGEPVATESAAAGEPLRELDADERALVDESMKKSGLIWVDPGSGAPAQAMWYVWLDGAAIVVTGGDEQPDAGLAAAQTARVAARSKDTRSRLIEWVGTVTRITPGDADWDDVVAALVKARLNLVGSESASQRWAGDPAMAVYRVTPVGPLVEQPGSYPDSSGRATPVPTAATTAGPPPKVIHRRQTRRRPLS